jgi:hypothetical protein
MHLDVRAINNCSELVVLERKAVYIIPQLRYLCPPHNTHSSVDTKS